MSIRIFIAFLLLLIITPAITHAGWDLYIVDNTRSVGTHTSLAFDPSGYPAISYYDVTNNNLKFAWDMNGDGDFFDSGETQTVDDDEANVGLYTSLAFDPSGYPAISYYDVTNDNLKFAWDMNGDGDFFDSGEIQTVDSDGIVGEYTSLAFDPSGYPASYPAISYYDATNGNLKFAWDMNGDGDFADGGEIQTVDDDEANVGLYTSLAFDPSGYPAISYRGFECLKIAWDKDGNGIFGEDEKILIDSSIVVVSTSLAFDPSVYPASHPAISYCDLNQWDLKFAWDMNGDGDFADGGEIQTVDSDGVVGEYTSLAFDDYGYPAISYFDGTYYDLKFAWDMNGDGDFADDGEIQTVDSTALAGSYTSLAFDYSGLPAISYYDMSNADLNFARFRWIPAIHITYAYTCNNNGVPQTEFYPGEPIQFHIEYDVEGDPATQYKVKAIIKVFSTVFPKKEFRYPGTGYHMIKDRYMGKRIKVKSTIPPGTVKTIRYKLKLKDGNTLLDWDKTISQIIIVAP